MALSNNPDGGQAQTGASRGNWLSNAGAFSRVEQYYTPAEGEAGGLVLPNPTISIYKPGFSNNVLDKTYARNFKPNPTGGTSNDLVDFNLYQSGVQVASRNSFDQKRESGTGGFRRQKNTGLFKTLSWQFV